MSESEKFYEALELPPGSSLAKVKEAFRELAKQWHPDLYPYDEQYKLLCQTKMARLNEAYQFLKDVAPSEDRSPPPQPQARWGYDPGNPAGDREQPGARKPGADGPPPFTRHHEEAEPEISVGPYLGPRPKTSWSPFKRAADDEPDMPGVCWVGLGYACSIASLAAIFFIPHPAEEIYFETVRLVVSGSCVYAGWFAFIRSSWEVGLAMLLLTSVLNPIFPVPMSHEDWKIFNFVTPSALIYFWVILYEREAKKEHLRAIKVKKEAEDSSDYPR